MGKRQWVNKGQVLLVSRGIYDGYHIEGIVRATKRFSVLKAEAEFLAQDDERESFTRDERFAGWLNHAGYVEPIDYLELSMGDWQFGVVLWG